MSRTCSIPGCDKPYSKRGFCHSHYCKLRYTGELQVLPKRTVEERFWRLVDTRGGPEACWPWMGEQNQFGYGIFRAVENGVRKVAHRIAYETATGRSLGELQADHLCHNTACCNPAHLRPATNKQNGENRRGAYRNSRTGVRGVFPHKASGRWTAQVKHNWQTVYLGLFDSIEDAAAAVLAKRLELFTYSDMDLRLER